MSTTQPDNFAIRLEAITKRFGGIVANDHVDVAIRASSWHAIVGENGAGKSTLLSVLYGVYRPDGGRIIVDGLDVTRSMRAPVDAIRLGIGLVTQHYSLVPGMTVLENIVLGKEPPRNGGRIDWSASEARAVEHAQSLGLDKRLIRSPIESLSPAAQQKVEITKALFRGASILLLDEPTATLAPHEAESLLATLRSLKDAGTTIVVVTHKLREVFDHSDDVTVMRNGKSAGTFATVDVDRDHVFQLMIGEDSAPSAQPAHSHTPDVKSVGTTALRLSGVNVAGARGSTAVKRANFEVRAGEIVGFAGVDGNGQTELAEAIVGVRAIANGSLEIHERPVTSHGISGRRKAGVAYIPADRNRDGLIPSFTIEQNVLLGHETDPAWGGGFVLHPRRLRQAAVDLISEWDIRGAGRGGATTASSLSGGNQQKLLVGRSLMTPRKVLVACQPTRGLDIRAAQAVYDRLRQEAASGVAILLFSLDLDEIMELSNRIIVMFDGATSPAIDRADANRDMLGRLMTGLTPLTEVPE